MTRGYCGIGVLNMKSGINYGTLFRSAINMDASFIFLIGKRFKAQCSDTTRADRHMPLYEHKTTDEFFASVPRDCVVVAVETDARAIDLRDFNHPERAIYLLGAEDHGIPEGTITRCRYVVSIPSDRCLNVSVAGSIVLYDRIVKNAQ